MKSLITILVLVALFASIAAAGAAGVGDLAQAQNGFGFALFSKLYAGAHRPGI